MKKIIFTLLISSLSIGAFAQTFVKDTVEYIGFVKDGTTKILKDSIFNTSMTDTLFVTWSKSYDNLSQGWTGTAVCDPKNCYTWAQTLVPKTFKLAPQKWGVVYVDVIASANAGNDPVFVTLTSTSGDITYKFQSAPTSTKDFDNSNFVNIYPNPATNYINIALNDKNISSVNVMNLIGKKIAKFAVDANRSPINVPLDNVSTGVYLLQFADAKGKVIGVKKVTKQ